MRNMLKERQFSFTSFHFERPRLNQLFLDAVKYPLVVVCAGAGYGKTSAVNDFAQEYQASTTWIQLSERDNVAARFWENFTHAVALVNIPFANAITKLGFPDTKEKINQYMVLLQDLVKVKQRIIVMDDFHCIEDPQVIRFVEECLVLKMPPGTSLFLLTRSTPRINTAGFVSRGVIFNLGENDLRFTENELAQYFRNLDISVQPEHVREIMQDTEGWVFSINLIARSYQKAPGYNGYLRSAMKENIFRLMETEVWDEISRHLQLFLVRLSLIDHLSFDLVAILSHGKEELTAGVEKQNAYIRRDSYINTYHIHPLFLEFLTAKQDLLSEEQKHETYKIAGVWCNKNGFNIDALSYYEKIGDYISIVSVLFALPAQIPYDIAKYASEILDRAPAKVFDKVDFLAMMHLCTYMCQGFWKKSAELAEYYETRFLKLRKNDPFRNHALSTLYYCWGNLRVLMCLTDDSYDFDVYYEKFCKFLLPPLDLKKLYNHGLGPWVSAVGSSRKGALEECIESLTRTADTIARHLNGFKTGKVELAHGELKFYKGQLRAAETLIAHALEQARENKQFEVIHRALFYVLRMGIAQGDYQKAEQALKEMKSHLDEDQYINRFTNYDISASWYLCIIGLPEEIPDWLKENFSPYGHASFIENFANIMKAWFCFLTRNYPPLLSYIKEMKKRESFLFGRIEMLAMEACVYYRMKEKKQSFAALYEAYKIASPNDIVMPFIELGKDMRTLTTTILKESKSKIPKPWLENINRKSSSYAKQQVHIIKEYRQAHRLMGCIALSPRESEILADLSRGLSRAEIAASRSLSINTVKTVINSIYMKSGAENLADLIRIAVEQKLV